MDIIKFKDIKIFPPHHPEILALSEWTEEPSIHGHKIWEASFVMMDFLEQFPLALGSNILEIGCGWGILTTYLAKEYPSRIVGLDADPAVKPYFDFHAAQNHVDLTFQSGTMKSMTKKALSDYDVIIGCDICFWDALKNDWKNLIRRALKAGVQEIYITDPGRPPFWELVAYAEKKFGAEIWSHETTTPYSVEQYVLEIRSQ